MMTLEEKHLAEAFPSTYLTFRLGGKIFGFEARCLWEISTSITLSSLPRSSSQLVGITQLHGKIIPVVDLGALLKLPFPGPGQAGNFIAVKPPGFDAPTGFYAEEVLGFEKFSEADIQSPPESGLGFQKGLAGTPQRPVELLKIERILERVKKALAAGAEPDSVLPGGQN